MKGMQNIKTSRSARISSLPKIQRNPYLELFMLQSEKEKLKIEYRATKKRIIKTECRMKEIDKQIKELQLERGYFEKKKIPVPKGHTDVVKNPGKEEPRWSTIKLKY